MTSFVSMANEDLSEWGLLLKERELSLLFSRVTAIKKGGKNENDRVASPEHVPIYFN